jgi:hypothetical protein
MLSLVSAVPLACKTRRRFAQRPGAPQANAIRADYLEVEVPGNQTGTPERQSQTFPVPNFKQAPAAQPLPNAPAPSI